MVAAQTPALRTSYMKFPWPTFYEHPINIATLNIDRQVADEHVVLQVHIPSPETRTLHELDVLIHEYQQQPVEDIPSYQTAVRMSDRRHHLQQQIDPVGERELALAAVHIDRCAGDAPKVIGLRPG